MSVAFDAIDLWLRDTYAYVDHVCLSYVEGLTYQRDRKPEETVDLPQFLRTPDVYLGLAEFREFLHAGLQINVVVPGLRDVYHQYRQYLPSSSRIEIEEIIRNSPQCSFHPADYYPEEERTSSEIAEEPYLAGYLISSRGINGETISLGMEYNETERTLVAGWLLAANRRLQASNYVPEEPLLDVDPVFPVIPGTYLYGSLTPYDLLCISTESFVETINEESFFLVDLPSLPVKLRLHFDRSDFYDDYQGQVVGPIPL